MASKKKATRQPEKGRPKPRAGSNKGPGTGPKKGAGKGPKKGGKKGDREKAGTGKKDDLIRLNKFLAHAGICSRREADTLIESGAVKVNGKVVTELGTKVRPDDKIQYGKRVVKPEKPVYVLLNKPKDHITTTADEKGRKTVMELVRNACRERLYPVGRLDRNTTGLLLLTNDGAMAKKLTHPRAQVQKLYHVILDRNLKSADMEKLTKGVELEDGKVAADSVAFVKDSASGKREVGLTIHSGRNRVIRRMFEALGYDVKQLDRVMFAGLTKKDIPRGSWRYLSEKEVAQLRKKLSTAPG